MTYNVDFSSPPQQVISVIEKADADVVCLQETTSAWPSQLRSRLRSRYPYMLFHHDPPAGGLAILSRQPIKEVFHTRPPAGWFNGWAVVARTNLGDVQFLNVHLRPPKSDAGHITPRSLYKAPEQHRQEIEYLHAKLRPDLPTIVLGDFNEDDRGSAVQFLRDKGFGHALREFDPTATTWHWQKSVVRIESQYDHILYSASLRCYEAKVLREGPSDHYPVISLFGPVELRPSQPSTMQGG